MKTIIDFVIISYSLLPRIRNVFKQTYRENQNTHFILNSPPTPENRAVCEIMCKNKVQPERPQMTI